MNLGKDFKFIYWAAVWSLLIMAFMYLIQPAILPPDPRGKEIEDYKLKLELLSADAAIAELNKKTGKPTMLMVYASWCGYCRQLMPDVMQQLRDRKLDAFRLLFIARDKDLTPLATYLVHNDYHKNITPYVLSSGQLEPFTDKLRAEKNSNFRGGVPYTAFFDAQGNLTAEISGVPPKSELLSAIEQASRNTR